MNEQVDVYSCVVMAAGYINRLLHEKTGFTKDEDVSIEMIARIFNLMRGLDTGDLRMLYVDSRLVFRLLEEYGFPREFMDQLVKLELFGQKNLSSFVSGRRVSLAQGYNWAASYLEKR